MNRKSTELLRSPTVIGVLCIVGALLVGLVVFPLVNQLSIGRVTVVRANEKIVAGEKITAAMLYETQTGAVNLAAGTVLNENAVVGKYAAVTILPNDNLMEAKVSAKNTLTSLKNGQMLYSVTVRDFADGLSGKLEPGDIVRIYIPQSNTAAKVTASSAASSGNSNSPEELQYVQIVAVTNSKGTDLSGTEQTSSGTDTYATVTLKINAKQASLLEQYDSASLHFALVCRDNDKLANQLLEEQNNVLAGGSAVSSTSGAVASGTSSAAKSSKNDN